MGRKSHSRPASGAGAAAKPAGRNRTAGARTHADAHDLLDTSLEELWATIASADVLEAELQTSAFAALPLMADSIDQEPEDVAAAVIDSVTQEQFTPEGAAFCRILMSLGSPALKRQARQALAEYTDGGVYPPGWVTDIGKPVPGQAWRSYDVFGDEELIVVTFAYGDAEHAMLVAIDRTILPAAGMVAIAPDPAKLLETIHGRDEPFQRLEQISLAEARRRIEAPLARADEDLDPEFDGLSFVCLPVARSRVRRLPAEEPAEAVLYTAADRAAAVADFLRSPQAAEAGDVDDARFWAEVLTGYSSRVPGEPPAQVGPHKLAAMLLSHVASTFTLSAAQRESLQPAVTAWTRWAAGRQGLDEAAVAHVLDHLPKVFDNFDSAYDDPHNVVARGYTRDLATSDVDVAWLMEFFARRVFAAPLPAERDPGVAALDATDPDHRAVIVVSEFAMCDPRGVTREGFVDAAKRLAEELWHDDPPATWQTAKRLLGEGMSRHDIIHALAR
jgi:hypothetical protein